MSIWKSATLQELYAEPSRNGLNRPKSVRGKGYKMINMGELFTYDRIRNQPMELVLMSEKEIANYGVQEGDLLFARQSLVAEGTGKCSIVMSVPQITTFESHLIRVRLKKQIANPLFYYYYFTSSIGKGNVQSLVMQVAAAGIRGSELARLTVPHPPINIQRRIAAVLSAYDDLIENNQRRIAILEEMARSFYREWFVEFRFPGHEGVEIVERDGVLAPEGWEVITLGEISDRTGGVIQTGPFGSQLHQSDYKTEGVPVVMPKDLINGRIAVDTIARVDEEDASRLSRYRLQKGDVVYGRRGDIGRRALVTSREETWLCGTGCLLIRLGETSIKSILLYLYLGRPEVVAWIANKAVGATMPNLNTGILRSITTIVPSQEVQEKAFALLDPVFEAIHTLAEKNITLCRTRDLLLPRLVSSELDVSELEIAGAAQL